MYAVIAITIDRLEFASVRLNPHPNECNDKVDSWLVTYSVSTIHIPSSPIHTHDQDAITYIPQSGHKARIPNRWVFEVKNELCYPTSNHPDRPTTNPHTNFHPSVYHPCRLCTGTGTCSDGRGRKGNLRKTISKVPREQTRSTGCIW